MGYVDSNLLKDETIVLRAKFHKIIFFWPAIFTFLFILIAAVLPVPLLMNWTTLVVLIPCFVISFYYLFCAFIKYISSDFTVTSKRIIVKLGLVDRETTETLLQQIESIEVKQTILGRMFNFGHLTISGIGGTQESFDYIADPVSFRRAVQEQTEENVHHQ